MAGKRQEQARRRLPAEERREEILRTAMDLFARDGFEGVRTKDLAEACGVSEALLYRFFACKADLYEAIIERKIGRFSEERYMPRDAVERGDDEAVLGAAALQMVAPDDEDPGSIRVFLYSALEGHDLSRRVYKAWISRVENRLAAYLDRRQEEGDLGPFDAKLAARLFVGQVSHLKLVKELFGAGPSRRRDWKKVVNDLVALTLEGLRRRPRGSGGKKR